MWSTPTHCLAANAFSPLFLPTQWQNYRRPTAHRDFDFGILNATPPHTSRSDSFPCTPVSIHPLIVTKPEPLGPLRLPLKLHKSLPCPSRSLNLMETSSLATLSVVTSNNYNRPWTSWSSVRDLRAWTERIFSCLPGTATARTSFTLPAP